MSHLSKFFQKQFHVFFSYKNNLIKLLSIFLFFQFFTVCDAGQNAEKKEILLRLISEFQIDLQKNLESAIRTKGVVGAIDVCRTISTEKEAALKTEFPGILIRRVSEKPRNPNHQPDAWETEIFNQWKESQKNRTHLILLFYPKTQKFGFYNRSFFKTQPVYSATAVLKI